MLRSTGLFVLLSTFLFCACQTFPPGERLKDIARAPDRQHTVKSVGNEIEYSVCQLYRYFTMCRAVWKIRDSYKDADWQLDYFYDEPTNTLGLTILENGVLHIIFRSSQAPKDKVDLKYNSRFLKRRDSIFPNDKIRAHRGFLDKYHSIRPEVLARVEATETPKIRLIGHSGGAAMVGIAFMDLRHRYPQIEIDAVTYGMVRVFNHHGQEWFEPYRNEFLRIVNGRDPFPNIPPALFGYRHVGRLIRIGRRPWYKIFSSYDHYRGYQHVLEEMLIERGVEPSDCY